MQILTKKSYAETGNLKVNKFKGKLNAKAFRLLTDNIYSDKIAALIRELSTNAKDTQKEAGYTGGFEVHLPTMLQPYFYIRDYGVGMDEDMIVNTYTVFFESTKDESNEFTGCLGLGSKTPLHYHTKSCTVNSYKDGIHYIYSCFMGSDGCPNYTKLSQTETTEPNGVKVEFPVNKNDIESFHQRASIIYSWFEEKPVFIGKSVDIQVQHYTIDNPDWKLRKSGPSGVLMGNIFYPIESYKAKELDKYNSMIDSGILLVAEIGEVEFDMSREHLSYSTLTTRYIANKFEKIKLEYIDNLQAEINKCQSYFGAQCKFYELSCNKLTSIFGIDSKKLSFNNKPLSSSVKYEDGIGYYKYYYRKTFSIKNSYSPSDKYFTITNHLLIVVNDLKTGCLSRLKKFIEESEVHSGNSNSINVILYKNVETAKKELECDESNVIFASTLAKPEYNKIGGTKRGNIGSWPVYSYEEYVSKCWVNQNIDIENTKGFYIIRNGYNVIINNKPIPPQSTNELIKIYSMVNSDELTIIGCPATHEGKLVKAGWKNLEQEVSKIKLSSEYKDICLTQMLKSYIADRYNFLTERTYYSCKFNYNFKLIRKLNPDLCESIKAIQDLCECIEKQIKNRTNYNFDITQFKDEFNKIKVGPTSDLDALESVIERVKLKYPLFNSIDLDKMSAKMIEPYIIGVNHV